MARRKRFVITPRMLGHCVYVWKKRERDGEDTVMYVGVSANGVRRFSQHHALPYKYAADDYIELWPCASYAEADDLERRMIRELKPLKNKVSQTSLPMEKRDRSMIPCQTPQVIAATRHCRGSDQ